MTDIEFKNFLNNFEFLRKLYKLDKIFIVNIDNPIEKYIACLGLDQSNNLLMGFSPSAENGCPCCKAEDGKA